MTEASPGPERVTVRHAEPDDLEALHRIYAGRTTGIVSGSRGFFYRQGRQDLLSGQACRWESAWATVWDG